MKASHQEPRHGGRKRADGVDVKWAVTFPAGEDGGQASRGRVPFFCHDVTERKVRVPLAEDKTSHASGVLGVKELTVTVKDEEAFKEVKSVYDGLFGSAKEVRDGYVEYEVGRVVEVPGLEGVGGAKIKLNVGADEDGAPGKSFRYGDVVLAVRAGEGKKKGERERIDQKGGGKGLRGVWVEYV